MTIKTPQRSTNPHGPRLQGLAACCIAEYIKTQSRIAISKPDTCRKRVHLKIVLNLGPQRDVEPASRSGDPQRRTPKARASFRGPFKGVAAFSECRDEVLRGSRFVER